MTPSPTWWRRGMLAVGICACLPWLRTWWNGGGLERCAFDAAVLNDRYRVRLVFKEGEADATCCGLWCAEQWLKASGRIPRQIWLADEVTGESVNATNAVFVKSQVPANPLQRDFRHVFADRSRAGEHARRFRGRVLPDYERPFTDIGE